MKYLNDLYLKYLDSIAFKMSASAVIALLIGSLLNLQFSAVASVIAILSIQDTRKKTLVFARKRIIACILSIFLSVIIYKFIGQNSLIFGIFLIIFIPLTARLKVSEGMVPAVVLSTHLLTADSINRFWIINEVLLMIIGVGVATISNLFMPSYVKEFNKDKEYIEEKYKWLLDKMSKSLLSYTIDMNENKVISELEKRLKDSLDRAYKIVNNKLLSADTYYVDYMTMRINQFNILMKLRRHYEYFYMSFEQTYMISKFTKNVSSKLHEKNDCSELLQDLEILREDFKKMALPKTREEFENRSQLLQFLNDMEDLLEIKRSFILNNITE